MRCTCPQTPKIRQTGWSEKHEHPEYQCPVCKKGWWKNTDGVFIDERPFAWPSKEKKNEK